MVSLMAGSASYTRKSLYQPRTHVRRPDAAEPRLPIDGPLLARHSGEPMGLRSLVPRPVDRSEVTTMVIQIARAPSGVSVWEIPQHRLQSQIMLQLSGG